MTAIPAAVIPAEKIRLACIVTPELRGKCANPVPAKAARNYLRVLVVGRKVGIMRIMIDRYSRMEAELFWMAKTCSSNWSLLFMQRLTRSTRSSVPGSVDLPQWREISNDHHLNRGMLKSTERRSFVLSRFEREIGNT